MVPFINWLGFRKAIKKRVWLALIISIGSMVFLLLEEKKKLSTLIETKLLDLKHGQEIIIEKKPNDEIYGKKTNNNLKIHNYYFEITPPEYISGIIS